MPDKSKKDEEGKRKFKGKRIERGIWKKAEVEYVSGEIIVKLKPGKDRDTAFLERLLSSSLKNAKIRRKFDRFGIGIIDVGAQVNVLKESEALKKHPEIEYAEPNMIDRMTVTIPNDIGYPNQWALPMISAPEAWDIERGNANVLIGILDSGIPMDGTPLSLSHPDLNDTSRIILGHDYVNDSANPRDDNGHGTHVTGIASAASNNGVGVAGLSWGSRIYVVKVLDDSGYGSHQNFHDGVIEVVDYAVNNNLRLVINYSGGGSASNTKEQAIVYARDRGCVIVAAAGNDYSGSVIYPAAYSSSYDNVIAVSATDSADAFANYSNKGPEINVAAPGSHIFSTMPNYHVELNNLGFSQDYDYLDGTSMAAPLVSGLAALILSCDDSLSAAEVRDIIESEADDLGSSAWDEYYGYGRIDAFRSLEEAHPEDRCAFIGRREVQIVECLIRCLKETPTYCRNKCEQRIMTIPCSFRKELSEGEPTCPYRCEYRYEGEMCTREMPVEICPVEGKVIRPRERVIRRQYPAGKRPVEPTELKHIRLLTKRSPMSHKRRYSTPR